MTEFIKEMQEYLRKWYDYDFLVLTDGRNIYIYSQNGRMLDRMLKEEVVAELYRLYCAGDFDKERDCYVWQRELDGTLNGG